MDLAGDPIRHRHSVADVVTFLCERARGIAGLSGASPGPTA
ncbi:hypothetical protein [Rhodopila globiformis]|nr:hypothetical protein [Rhodopila globiformis]